jgi:hypothetical protein
MKPEVTMAANSFTAISDVDRQDVVIARPYGLCLSVIQPSNGTSTQDILNFSEVVRAGRGNLDRTISGVSA